MAYADLLVSRLEDMRDAIDDGATLHGGPQQPKSVARRADAG